MKLCQKVTFRWGKEWTTTKSWANDFSSEWRSEYLKCLSDVVASNENLKLAENESVFKTSLLRGVRIDDIRDQFASVLRGEISLTNFDFGFDLPASDKFAGFDLQFQVKANSLPSTNMHALIGRNGVGKTTYLNEMVRAVSPHCETTASFYTTHIFSRQEMDAPSYFGSLVSVAFSAFEPIRPAANYERSRRLLEILLHRTDRLLKD